MGSNQQSRTLSRMDVSATAFGMPRWEPAAARPTIHERQQRKSFEQVLKEYKPTTSPLSKYRRYGAERPWSVRGA